MNEVILEREMTKSGFSNTWTGVNFININRTNFSYERHFGNGHVTRKKLLKPMFVRKIRAFNVDEIDTMGRYKENLLQA